MFTTNDFSDVELGYSVFFAEHLPSYFSWFEFYADFQNLLVCQFYITIPFAVIMSLLFAVGVVVFGCSQPKVFWIDAGRIVSAWAIMKDAHSFWDWAVVHFVGKTMGFSSIKCPVPVFVFTSLPNNTTVRFLFAYVFLEAFFWRSFLSVLVIAFLGAIYTFFGETLVENSFANWTNVRNHFSSRHDLSFLQKDGRVAWAG